MDITHLSDHWSRIVSIPNRALQVLRSFIKLPRDPVQGESPRFFTLAQGALWLIVSATLAWGAWKNSRESQLREWLDREGPSAELWDSTLRPLGLTAENPKPTAPPTSQHSSQASRLMRSLPQRAGIRGAIYADHGAQRLAVFAADGVGVRFFECDACGTSGIQPRWVLMGQGWLGFQEAIKTSLKWDTERRTHKSIQGGKKPRGSPKDARLLKY